jgi:DNA-binding MarR family transcriptional regulator
MAAYPRIYFACHQRHVRDPGTGRELSAHQASILSHLDSVDPIRLGELAEHMGVTDSTMSLSVKRLERDGYVSRARDPDDGRALQLRLTEAGERVRAAQSVLEPERVAALLVGMTPEDREAGLRGIELLSEAADRTIREDRPDDIRADRGAA